MESSEERFESLTKNIELYEKKVRQRILLSTLTPLLFGLILLSYTIWQIQVYGGKLAAVQTQLDETTKQLNDTSSSLRDANSQLDSANSELEQVQANLEATSAELERLKAEIESDQQKLEEVQSQLDEANLALDEAKVFVQNSYQIDILEEKNYLASVYPRQADILFYIQNLQFADVDWNLNGFSEEEGFNSPGFAVYVMKQKNLISQDYGAGAKPWEILPPVDRPSVGDIVYYEGGYCMFYFEQFGEGFVIGMTPLGIISLKPEFAPILGYLSVPY